MKRTIHRLLRLAGIHIEKHRDAFAEFANAAKDASIVVDGGAYQGAASSAFLSLFPRATIHAFEANPELAAAIGNQSERIIVHPVALSNVEGVSTFHVPGKAFTGSLLKPGDSFGDFKLIEVPQTTIDILGLKPDALKLDLQGAELMALKGAEATLADVRAVLCEVNFTPRYEGCVLFHEIAELLYRHGLNLHRLYEVHSNRFGKWQFADALFVRSL